MLEAAITAAGRNKRVVQSTRLDRFMAKALGQEIHAECITDLIFSVKRSE